MRNNNAAIATNDNASATATATATAPRVGDVLECSWGYEQTNIDYYEVLRVTAATVTLRKIAAEVVEVIGWESARVMPVPGKYVGEAFRRRFSRKHNGEVSCRISDYSWAYSWDGKPSNRTSYA